MAAIPKCAPVATIGRQPASWRSRPIREIIIPRILPASAAGALSSLPFRRIVTTRDNSLVLGPIAHGARGPGATRTAEGGLYPGPIALGLDDVVQGEVGGHVGVSIAGPTARNEWILNRITAIPRGVSILVSDTG